MKCRRVIGDKHRYWNIKGLGHSVMCSCPNSLSSICFC